MVVDGELCWRESERCCCHCRQDGGGNVVAVFVEGRAKSAIGEQCVAGGGGGGGEGGLFEDDGEGRGDMVDGEVVEVITN